MNQTDDLSQHPAKKKIYSRVQAMLMIETAILIAQESPTMDRTFIMTETMKLHDMAAEAGKRAAEAVKKERDENNR